MDWRIEQGWLVGARRCLSPNADERPTDEISLLVIHGISLPPERFGGGFIDALFTNELDPQGHPYFAQIADLRVSAHVLICRKGSVTQYVSFARRAWHAGLSSYQGRSRCNDFAIGIELEGSDTQPYTRAQYATLSAVCAALIRHYPGLSEQAIVGHCDIAPGRKTDPGPHFLWQAFFDALSRALIKVSDD